MSVRALFTRMWLWISEYGCGRMWLPNVARRSQSDNLGRIRPLLKTLLSYSLVIEVFVNAKPDVLAFIWGPIKLCLQVYLQDISGVNIRS